MHTSCQLVAVIPVKESLVVLSTARLGVCFQRKCISLFSEAGARQQLLPLALSVASLEITLCAGAVDLG